MSSSLRFGSALSALAAASMIGGCAASQKTAGFGGQVANSNIGAAMRALAAIQANDFATAIPLAERAVESSPDDAGFRGLLGNAYFGGGRFASAEAAYRDSLAILSNQPQVILKLALVQIAQGKNDQAAAFLQAAQGVLPAADYGLALALAGRSAEAIDVLEPAARLVEADARVRQNLALAHAFAGDWTAARTIAAQDVPADQLDARIQHWMALAKPARASDQVAALIGVSPAARDPGQPTRLALRAAPTRTAQAAPVVAPRPFAQAPVPTPVFAAAAAEPQVVDIQTAPEPVVMQLASGQVAVPAPSFEVTQVEPAKPTLGRSVTAKLPPARLFAPAKRPALHLASLPRREGNSTAVVQLGAYGSPRRVAIAWGQAAQRFSALRAYSPMSARFNSQKGVVYRLSVKGFGSAAEASRLCASVKRAGGSCFVRSVAGDQPVRMASR